ncbi:MAG: hypothetical protein LBQ89_07470 [Treponema sp.]|nr:hypothetical protein [Treponema sp.]
MDYKSFPADFKAGYTAMPDEPSAITDTGRLTIAEVPPDILSRRYCEAEAGA